MNEYLNLAIADALVGYKGYIPEKMKKLKPIFEIVAKTVDPPIINASEIRKEASPISKEKEDELLKSDNDGMCFCLFSLHVI